MINPFMKPYRMVISTLSPVHIGCGQNYEPTHYIIDEGVLYTFDPVAALSRDEKSRNELLEIVSKEQGDGIIQKIQKFFHTRKEMLLPLHTRRLPVGDGMQAFYDKRVGKTTQADTKSVNNLNIERTSFLPEKNHPVMPGSSLKGAIRTALLDEVHGGKSLSNREQAKDRRKSWKELSPLPDTLKGCLPKKFELDPMRLIRVGDACSFGPDRHNEVFFAVNRKSSGAEGKGPYQTLECLPPMGLESFTADISFLNPEQARKYDDVQPPDKKGLPPKIRQWDHTTIVQKCNTYYMDHLQRELQEMHGFLDQEWAKTIRQSIHDGELHWLLKSGHAFLLRVGRHCGAESVTLNGARFIYRPQGRDWVTEPSTVWLAARGINMENKLLPFGWLLVELDDGQRRPLDETAPELAKLAQRFKNDRASHLNASDKKLASIQDEEAKKNKAEEDRQALAAEKAAEEAAHQVRLAAMTPNQQKIAAFRQAISKEPIPQPISGTLWQNAGKLVKEAANWPAEDRTELARVCHEELPCKLKGVDKKKLQSLQDALSI
ncbi:MAG: type III-A CRISPR-associated RAMP protein Csm5 [Magnetococcales bacterium]|nr:type III-A CRISPR-associated RAMP protein Csm5 [Magnetococcales bacterium]